MLNIVNNMKAVSLLSGGVDSSTLLYWLMEEKYSELYPLTIIYGQKHSKEIDSAKKIAERLKIPHLIVDISSIKPLLKKGALTGEATVPYAHYSDETQKQTIVPNRNAILLSLATAYAITNDADVIAYAAHHSDRAVYPDCRQEFVEAFDKAMKLANLYDNPEIKIVAPFINMTKAEIVRLGTDMKVPYELTWSCYEGRERSCLKCGTCRERTEAFLLNDLMDPLLTTSEWEEALKYLNYTN